MRELTCKACGRKLRAGMTFCTFCGSKDIVSSTFNNVNNAYAYNKQAAARPNGNSYAGYNNRYPNINPKNNVYSNNMYANNNNNVHLNTEYSNSSSSDFDRRMDQMQQSIRNRSEAQSRYQNNTSNSSNDFSIKYGNNSYTRYENNNYKSNEYSDENKTSNPYVANKDFYTHNNQQSQSGYLSSYDSDTDNKESFLSNLSNLQKGLISFAAVLVVGLIILFCTGTFDPLIQKFKGNNSTEVASNAQVDNNGSVLTGAGEVEYTIGELNGNIYTNPWSNVKITIPEGYNNKDAESYKQYTTEFMSCGLYVENADGESIVNLYVDLANDDGTFTEEAYLDETKANYDAYGMEITNATEYDKITICGQEYTYLHLTAKSGSVTLTQSVYVRKTDDKACVFMVTSKGESYDSNKAIIESIQPYNA